MLTQMQKSIIKDFESNQFQNYVIQKQIDTFFGNVSVLNPKSTPGAEHVLRQLNFQGMNPFLGRRFNGLMKMLSSLHHANMIDYIGYTEYAETNPEALLYLFPVMYRGAETLADYITRQQLKMSDIRDMIISILNGLGYAHFRGMIHGHLDCQSVIVIPDSKVPKICDFGLYNLIYGRSVSPDDDIKSAGRLLEAMLLRVPFKMQHTQFNTEAVSDKIPSVYQAIVRKALNRGYAFAEEMAEEIRKMTVPEPVPVPRERQKKPVLEPVRPQSDLRFSTELHEPERETTYIYIQQNWNQKLNLVEEQKSSLTQLVTLPEKTPWEISLPDTANMIKRMTESVKIYQEIKEVNSASPPVQPTNNPLVKKYPGQPSHIYEQENKNIFPDVNETGPYPSEIEYRRLLWEQCKVYGQVQHCKQLEDWMMISKGGFASVFYRKRGNEEHVLKVIDFRGYLSNEKQGIDLENTFNNHIYALKQTRRELELYHKFNQEKNPAVARFYPEYSTPLRAIDDEISRVENLKEHPAQINYIDESKILHFAFVEMEFGLSYSCYINWLYHSNFYANHVTKVISELFEATSFLQPLIVHCDIKPENILLVKRDGKIHPVFIDFNSAHMAIQEKRNEQGILTEAGIVGRTKQYAPPELINVEDIEVVKHPNVDTYSVGVIAFEMLNDYAFSKGLKEEFDKSLSESKINELAPVRLEELGLSAENRRKFLYLLISCLKHAQSERPSTRQAADILYALSMTEKIHIEANEHQILEDILAEIKRFPTPVLPLEADCQAFADEKWLYPSENEFQRLAAHMFGKRGKTLKNTDIVIPNRHTGICYRVRTTDQSGSEVQTLQTVYRLTDMTEDEKADLIKQICTNFRYFAENSQNSGLLKLYPDFSSPLHEVINARSSSQEYLFMETEFGIPYINYMKWLFSSKESYQKYILRAVLDLLYMLKDVYNPSSGGVEHGRIRAENIMLVRRGNRCKPVLADFRLEETEKNSIYHMGVLLYEMFDGTIYENHEIPNINKKPKYIDDQITSTRNIIFFKTKEYRRIWEFVQKCLTMGEKGFSDPMEMLMEYNNILKTYREALYGEQ